MDDKLYHLSHPQKRIWYNEHIYENSSIHNIGGTVRIKGAVRIDLLGQALARVIQLNEGMRIRLKPSAPEVRQYVAGEQDDAIDHHNFSFSPQPEKAWRAWVKQEAERPFSLLESRLFYLSLFTIGEHDHGYLIKLHHIIADGWSIEIMIRHIHQLYEQLLRGELIDPTPYRNSYFDYIHQEQRYLHSRRKERNRSFWLDKLAEPPLLASVEDRPRLAGKRWRHVYSSGEGEAIRQLAASLSVSLNGLFTGLFALYWHKASHTSDLIIGMPLLNRAGKDKGIFGMFASTMPFRIKIKPELTAEAWFAHVNKELQACYYHQKYPYDLLIQDLTALHKQRPQQLFDMCVNYYNTKFTEELTGFPVENEEFYNGSQAYALQLIIREWSDTDGLSLDIDYRLDCYEEQQIAQLIERMNGLVDQISMNPHTTIADISLLSKQDCLLLQHYNETAYSYPLDKTVLHLFEEQAARAPDRTAVSLGAHSLTYRELNEKANWLAGYLRQRGVEAGSLIGLLTTHSIETVVSILAVWKSRCSYLPLDPELPVSRREDIMQDAGVQFMITNLRETAVSLPESRILTLPVLDGEYNGALSFPGLQHMERPQPEDAAYVIYTSGSTGLPKGTVINHESLTNYSCWARRMYTEGENDVFPLYSSLAFDLTVTSIFTPLISGGEIAVYPPEELEHALYRIIRDNRATVVKLTPSHLNLLSVQQLEAIPSSIRCFIVGGEDFKTETARDIDTAWDGKAVIYNEYGPTETTVGCMICKYDRSSHTGSSVPIGYPADNTQILLLDDQRQPVPPGIRGEIYIAGKGVGRGYLNRPVMTAERFVAHPFAEGQRMYRTGDYAMQQDDGSMIYYGRIDMEVKIRGHRVHLGEIESGLLRQPDIRQACVIEQKHANGSGYLCAYLVADRKQTGEAIRKTLLEQLPGYMVPEFYMFVEHIPLTVNGKIDRNALPVPTQQRQEAGRQLAHQEGKGASLAIALQEVLGCTEVSTKDQFFQLGGDSIKAIQISSRLRDRGWRLKVKDVLLYPVLEDMADRMEREETAPEQAAAAGAFLPLPAMAWLMNQQADLNNYNQSVLLKVASSLQPDSLEELLQHLIQHHDGFRVNYDKAAGQFVYHEGLLRERLPLHFYDLSTRGEQEQHQLIERYSTSLKASINPSSGFQLRMALFRLSELEQRLLLTAHHLVVDGVSWRILLSQLQQLCHQQAAGEQLSLPARTASLRSWSESLYAYAPKLPATEQAYWEANREVLPTFWAPEAGLALQQGQGDVRVEEARLSAEDTQALLMKANEVYSTKTHELLISALAGAIMEYSGRREMVIGLEGHGREDIGSGIDISNTIGWFTSIYPVRLQLDHIHATGEQIVAVKETLRQVPMNGFHYGLFKHLLQVWPGRETVAIQFNYLGEFMAETDNEWFRVASEYTGPDHAPHHAAYAVLDVHCYVMHGKLELRLAALEPYLDLAGGKRLLQLFMDQIMTHVTHCLNSEDVMFTPSDFKLANLSQQQLDLIFED